MMDNESKRGVDVTVQKRLRSILKQRFVSPTDAMLSPCSKRLNLYRSKVYAAKKTPRKLQFSESATKTPSKKHQS
ncbi:Protein BNS1 [Nakaseomyces glabratus]|uniref:Protein BNS1 n=1 Tax=Candida glabrata TaxID=5478 RepID=A0A0W0D5L2_CANGB|nr:Protein BNS1 [Nakaseomyces glabratus]KTA98719.1 Protein BNS1 [Nakaseomyces glabratus]KTB06877.1 Protein BNS1 [Nakaseomyces glabratus]KTB08616.1 Protein BNS1 [Nakaseomyces glabratus]KTB23279.1 Protein BNS1 [Nakaseomyces glabratus]